MRDTFRLLATIGQGAVALVLACFILTVLGFKLLLPRHTWFAPAPRVPSAAQVIVLTLALLVPVMLGGFWVFRKLRSHLSRRELLAVAICFWIFSPVSLIIAMPVAEIPAGYTGNLWMPLGLVGAFVSIVLIVWLVTFLPSVFILWLVRRIGRAEAT